MTEEFLLSMKTLVQIILEKLNEKQSLYLVSLVHSEGSTPRNAEAHMLVDASGWVAGTVGGGGMEYAAVLKAQECLREKKESFVQTFDLTEHAGMACGGYCQLLFTYCAEDSLSYFAQVYEALEQGNPVELELPLSGEMAQELKVKPYHEAAHRGLKLLDGKYYYVEGYGYDGCVYVFGAGHVARELVPLLSHLDFKCIVLDDRAEFASKEYFPDAVRVEQVDYCHLQQACAIAEQDYAVVMTRGHEHDANCERYLLHTPACYIGIMGSRNKARLTREALLADGYSEADLARITTPIGISIGSETPAEIAVSIAAQLIQVRAAKVAKH